MKNAWHFWVSSCSVVVLTCVSCSGRSQSLGKLIGKWQDRHGVLVEQFFEDQRFTRYAIGDLSGKKTAAQDTLKYTGTYEVVGDMLHTTDDGSTYVRTYKVEFRGDSAVTMTGEQVSLTFYRAR